MTSNITYKRTSNRQSGLSLASVLRPIHDYWISRTRRTVEPVLSRDASFWDRWTAVRYLDDPFNEHYHHEVALVGSVVLLLPAAVAGRLTILTETLDQTRAQLDRVGRRRGVARAVSVVAREFLDLFQLWCTEVEAAVGDLLRENLPEQSQQLLEALEVTAALES
jgi:hypothetical protein